MKNFILALLITILYVNICLADTSKTVDIDFRKVGIPELSNAVLGGMLNRDYLLSSDVLSDDRKVTMSLKSVDQTKILSLFKRLMASHGINVDATDNVILLEKLQTKIDSPLNPQIQSPLPQSAPSSTELPFIKPAIYRAYRPINRSITYLAKVAKFTGSQVPELDDTSTHLFFSAESDDVLDKTENMLKISDTLNKGVTIKAALIEYTDSKNSSRSLSGVLTLLAGKLGLVLNAGQALANSLTFKNKTLNMAISAIDGDSSFKYLSEPTIRVLNGEKAKLIVGAEVPVRGQSTVANNGNVIQSVEYRTSGVQFEVQPKIVGDNVTLFVNQQISNFGQTTTSNIDSPTLFKRQSETTLDIKKGSLVMMAGLDETKSTISQSGVSFIPFLKSKTKDDSKSQILLLLEVLDDAQ